MFGLGKHGPDGKYAIILDIGSASVAAAIVASDSVTKENPVLYSHREWAVIKDASTENPTRFIEEAILRLFLVLGNTGGAALKKYDPSARISYIQTSISAPWAHTITQQTEYENEETFKITDKLISNLVKDAQKQSMDNLKTTEFLKREGLEIITNKTLHMTANGYTIKDPRNLETNKLYISHSSGIASSKIVAAIKKHAEEVFPEAQLLLNTFLLTYYTAIRDIFPETAEMTLIDITGEATEVGIVRNEELTKVAHSLIGSQTLIRILSAKLKVPIATAKAFLQDNAPNMTDKQKIVAESVFEEYVEEVSNLLKSMGDILTVPSTMYLHTDKYSENFFKKYIAKASARATGGIHTVIPITKKILPEIETEDTAILLSSFVFHSLHEQGTLAK